MILLRPAEPTAPDDLFPSSTFFRAGVAAVPDADGECAADRSPFRARPVRLRPAESADRPAGRRRSWRCRTVMQARRTRPAGHHCSATPRSEEHTSELQALIRNSYAVFCLNKKKHTTYRSNCNT